MVTSHSLTDVPSSITLQQLLILAVHLSVLSSCRGSSPRTAAWKSPCPWGSSTEQELQGEMFVRLATCPAVFSVITGSWYYIQGLGLHMFDVLLPGGLQEIKSTRLHSVLGGIHPCRSSGVESIPLGFQSFTPCIFRLVTLYSNLPARRPLIIYGHMTQLFYWGITFLCCLSKEHLTWH